MREIDTRAVPWQPNEVAYALNRHDPDRTPIPKPGDRVHYRRHEWDQHPTVATILTVADLDDRTDPNLWHPVKDHRGQVMIHNGFPMMVRAPDPLPWVNLRPDDAVEARKTPKPPRCQACGNVHTGTLARTWEARVRGMPGWLPLGWTDRPVRPPHELVMRPILPAIDRWRAENPGAGR